MERKDKIQILLKDLIYSQKLIIDDRDSRSLEQIVKTSNKLLDNSRIIQKYIDELETLKTY